ncbi:MAG: thioredoxin domain-containing protein [Vicinamibacterales bacterium]
MKIALAVIAALGVALALTIGLPGQSTEAEALKKEIEALKARTAALERDLADMRARLGVPRPPGADGPISLAGAKIRGSDSARVMLLELSDYQCPFCGRHFRDTMPQIEKEYIATGKIRYAFRDFPIESLHRQAVKAHEAANCAADQNKYWPMHNRLFTYPNPLGPDELKTHAAAVGVELGAFQLCVDSGKHVTTVQQSVEDAVSSGVTGTPAFFVGVIEADGKSLKVARFINGAQPYARFKQEIDALLASN